jgi:hypothetical protein
LSNEMQLGHVKILQQVMQLEIRLPHLELPSKIPQPARAGP